MSASPTAATLRGVTSALPAGEARPGQVAMAEAVAEAIAKQRHLVVQAGTGTGKSLGYLVPAIASGQKVVVATATKALQDQLAHKDLPFLAEELEHPFTWAVLKGRSNYVCRQRVSELRDAEAEPSQLELDGLGTRVTEEINRIIRWAERSESGDRAEYDAEPSPRAWSAVSVTSQECPGASRCPMGESCFAEAARHRADAADVVVVNTHLFGVDLASEGAILPEHELVVIDEAHQLEEIVSATTGLQLTPGRLRALARTVRAIIADDELVEDLEASGPVLAEALGPLTGRRLPKDGDPALTDTLTLLRERLNRAMRALRAVPNDGPGDVAARKQRAIKATTSLLDDLAAAISVPDTHVAWVEVPNTTPELRVAPVDVAEVLQAGLWGNRTAILTSATIAPAMPERLGLESGRFVELDVGSPFDFESNALLYCALHLPDPRHADFESALHDELEALISAAQGRTLALFTSWRAMRAAAEALEPRLKWPVLTQADLPKPALLAAFTGDEHSSLFATMGFWQGVDVPGASLSLVTIDRLPFARPDEPLLQARRERAGPDAFRLVDLPLACTRLAQGAGRLIRTATDRGVVAVCDRRLATARYRWDLVRALPPMRRTRHREEVVAFLRSLHQ